MSILRVNQIQPISSDQVTIAGDVNVTGTINASSVSFTGNTSANCISDLWVQDIHPCNGQLYIDGSLNVGGADGITASYFYGNGSYLTGISTQTGDTIIVKTPQTITENINVDDNINALIVGPQIQLDPSVQITVGSNSRLFIFDPASYTGSTTGNTVAGTSGSSGTSGTNGSSGTNGASGTNGTSGSRGTSGTSGSSGTNGTSGTSGINGSSGESGTNGTSGTSPNYFGIFNGTLNYTAGTQTIVASTYNSFQVGQFIIFTNNVDSSWLIAQISSYNQYSGILEFNGIGGSLNGNVTANHKINLSGNYSNNGSSGTSGINGTSGSSGLDGSIFTGNTSGDCISDIWVSNLYGCNDTLNINNGIYVVGAISANTFYGDGSNLTGLSGGTGTSGSSGTSGTDGTSGSSGISSGGNYSGYTVLMTQTGTTKPTVEVLHSDFGAGITLSYINVGEYQISCTGGFAKAWMMIDGNGAYRVGQVDCPFFNISKIDDSTIQIMSFTGTPSTGMVNNALSNTSLEIRSYA